MKEKAIRFSLISLGILSSLILLIVFAEYVLPVIMPFLLAWLVVTLTASSAIKLSERIKSPVRIIRLLMSLLLCVIFFLTLALLVWQISSALWRLLSDIEEDSRFYETLSAIFSMNIPVLGDLPFELVDKISGAVERVISGGLTLVANGITSLVSGLPRLFLFLLVTLISLVYFALDYDKISAFITSVLPKRVSQIITRLRTALITVVKKYVFSYFILLLITYSVMLCGLWLLRIDHAPVIALFISILDLLPIIGVGTVLIPWSIIELAMGNKLLGIGLILLFVVNAVIRQLSEPRIVGKSLNLHPVITLIMIYVGYSLFGFLGVLILPVIAVSVATALNAIIPPKSPSGSSDSDTA